MFMLPVGLLMKEHRLIEKMIKIIGEKAGKVSKEDEGALGFVDTAADFVRTYADRTHHGKEEDILFRELSAKKLSSEHKRIMDELIAEHKIGRANVKAMLAAKQAWLGGDRQALKKIAEVMMNLAEFYPRHIEKEDKHFFLLCMDYFTPEEKDRMLAEMRTFDQKMIHEKYAAVVAVCEKEEA